MSSKKGTPPQRGKNLAPTIEEEAADALPLDKGEVSRLNFLGYKKEHIAELSLESARQIIAKKEPRPGSKAHHKAQEDFFRKSGLVNPGPRFTDEEVEKRNAGKPQSSGVVVTLDEYSQKVIAGRDPIDATLLDLEARFPGQRFRAINPNLPTVAGPQFQTVYDENRQAVKVGDLVVGFMPEEVYDKAYRQPNLERSKQMSGQMAIPKNVDGVNEQGSVPVPVVGDGIGMQQSLRNY